MRIPFRRVAALALLLATGSLPFLHGAEPTPQEAELISNIRIAVARVTRITVDYIDPPKIISRFVELMAKKASLGLSAGGVIIEPAQATLFSL